jgi:hypothetical protein
MRLQCERELKGTLIQLREHLLLAGDDAAAAGRLLAGSVSSLVALYRSRAAPFRWRCGRGVGRRTCTRGFGADRRSRRAGARGAGLDGAKRFSADPGGPLVAGYVEAVSRAVTYVDELPVTE